MTTGRDATSIVGRMSESARVFVESRPAALRAWVASNVFRLGVASVTVTAAAFLAHQLMAWPPHEDETLALFVGRGALPEVVEHVMRERGGAPLHFVVAWAVAHLELGLGALRAVSATFAVASLPLIAVLGRRLAGPTVGLLAAALASCSWGFLFHGVYGRMYSLFLLLATASFLTLLRALDTGRRRAVDRVGGSVTPARRDPPVRGAGARGAGGLRGGEPT